MVYRVYILWLFKVDKALKVLGWKTEKSLEDMCRDSWNWQKNNLNGYNK